MFFAYQGFPVSKNIKRIDDIKYKKFILEIQNEFDKYMNCCFLCYTPQFYSEIDSIIYFKITLCKNDFSQYLILSVDKELFQDIPIPKKYIISVTHYNCKCIIKHFSIFYDVIGAVF